MTGPTSRKHEKTPYFSFSDEKTCKNEKYFVNLLAVNNLYEFQDSRMTHYSINSAMKARLANSLTKSKLQAESRKFASPSTRRVTDPRGSILLIHKRIATTASARQEIDKYRRM